MSASLALLLLSACGPDRTGLNVIAAPVVGTGDTATATVGAEPDLAGQITISKISIYQGVEIVLWEDGEPATTFEAPIITNRGALLRVFLEPDADFETRKVVGNLTLRQSGDEEELLTAKRKVDGPSSDSDLKSTLNFDLTADQVRKPTEFFLEIREETADAPGGGKEKKVTFDSQADLPGGLDTQPSDEVIIAIKPIRYNYDGSGRTPDLSATNVEAIQNLAQSIYPASTVTIRVDSPVNWNNQISAWNGNQWSNILDEIADLRDAANEPPNTYYYGMFDPEPTLFDFCTSGCILGLSNLGWSTTQEYLRSSVGVGYSTQDVAAETLVHEVGHAHGRDHAPCGVSPSDPNYPYNGAGIGSWGYSIVQDEVYSPTTYVDMMSYCSPIWVSDYTYYSLWQRISTLSGQARGVPQRVTRLRVDTEGRTSVRGTVHSEGLGGGLDVDVQLYDDQGLAVEIARGWMFPNSHFAGGVVTLDRELPAGWTADVL